MYNNKFVLTVIQNGQIIKELENGQVNIPFNSEYKIRLRNKHSRRAVCKLHIDGENVSGGGFIIEANSFVDIERTVETARKFKFVSLDSEEAYDYGKNGPNYDKKKGTIVAEFALEKEYVAPVYAPYPVHPLSRLVYPWRRGVSGDWGLYDSSRYIRRMGEVELSDDTLDCCNLPTANCGAMKFMGAIMPSSTQALKDGATVEGGWSNQRYATQFFNNEDEWTSVRLFLQGYDPSCINAIPFMHSADPVWRKLKESDLPKPYQKDEELLSLEERLNELRKAKARKEIEQLEAELA